MTSQIESLKAIAKKRPKRIVLPEGNEPRIIEAAGVIASKGIAEIILIGDESKIKKAAGIQVIEPAKYPKLKELIDIFYNARKHKGITPDEAKNAVLADSIFFGALLVRTGVADGFVAGASHTTSSVAKAALYCLGLEDGVNVMSSSFLIELADSHFGDKGLFIFGDCGIVPDPDAEKLADIAISCSRLYKKFFSSSDPGRKPYVALLSYSTKGSSRGDSIDKVVKALVIIKKKAPDLDVDGELQLDAAVVPEVAKIKAPKSPVAGRANVLIFPNLDAGNIAYKLTQRLSKARVVGPLMQGVRKPCSDLSRGCCIQEIIDAVVVTAVRAQ
ncbi:MAG: phosphate acetyltransferase [Candidatus Omnitrophica bacterium]|nr:phosphate acetyltransferase [Candidatus Omnitrophota bacterium]